MSLQAKHPDRRATKPIFPLKGVGSQAVRQVHHRFLGLVAVFVAGFSGLSFKSGVAASRLKEKGKAAASTGSLLKKPHAKSAKVAKENCTRGILADFA